MAILDSSSLKIERAVMLDLIEYEGGKLIVHDDRAAIAKRADGGYKCVFADMAAFEEYAGEYKLWGSRVCVMNMPLDAPDKLGFSAEPCKTYAYFSPMPPTRRDLGITIKRLAPTLAQTVLSSYHNPSGSYGVNDIERMMRDKGIFGAIDNGALAGYIGRHTDGHMGMLEVFEKYRRRGIGAELEKFMITYVMTFGRTPLCDVFADNAQSIAMQEKLGLTPSENYTFWTELPFSLPRVDLSK